MESKLPRFDASILGAVAVGAQLYELSHAMAPSMPVYHQHIPFSLALHRRHGDPHPVKREDGSSFANEVIVTSGHSGTHIDALGHFSRNGCLHGGRDVSEVETRDGMRELNAADIPPSLQPAVVLDVAAARNAGATDADVQLAVLIAAAFSMYNRLVDGFRARTLASPEAYRARAAEIASHGYSAPPGTPAPPSEG